MLVVLAHSRFWYYVQLMSAAVSLSLLQNQLFFVKLAACC